jgi:hypothetical protein
MLLAKEIKEKIKIPVSSVCSVVEFLIIPITRLCRERKRKTDHLCYTLQGAAKPALLSF